MSTAPNVLLIICDHLSPEAMGAYGHPGRHTPHMDALAQRGVAFSNVYTTCPLCQPARASFWTGLYPHQTRVRSNGFRHENGPLPEDIVTLGDLFSGAGYTAVHFGKQHDFGTLRGFEHVESGEKQSDYTVHPAWPEDYDTLRENAAVAACVDWLHGVRDKPFIAVADLNNPHDICNWIGHHDRREKPVRDVPIPGELPALPSNFEIHDLEKRPLPIQYLCCSHRRLTMAARWSETTYRHYIAAYRHYTELADRHVGMILDALDAGPAGRDTLVVLFADHADGMAHHRMVTKQVSMYDETTIVPLVMAGPGVVQQDTARSDALVSLLDLVPTLCDYAGIPVSHALAGRSLVPAMQGESIRDHRDHVVSEWHTEWGMTTSPGRMLRTPRYKYTRYLEGNGEELFDMADDPGETRTLVDDPGHADVLKAHRGLLSRHILESDDDFERLTVDVDPRWRSHPCGYPNHEGIAANDDEERKRRPPAG